MTAIRDSKGRFIKGNNTGNRKGRPKKTEEENLYTLMVHQVTGVDWIEITQKAMAQAKAGNKYARDWLSRYLLGEPEQYINVNADTVTRIIVEHVEQDNTNTEVT